jgi:acetyl esterase/lipase
VLNGATYVDGVADVGSAIGFLRAHAAEYGIDASRIALWGESAGGYLAAMAALTVVRAGRGAAVGSQGNGAASRRRGGGLVDADQVP